MGCLHSRQCRVGSGLGGGRRALNGKALGPLKPKFILRLLRILS
jgi:hypothetical protein